MDSLVFEHGRIMSPKREAPKEASTAAGSNGKAQASPITRPIKEKLHTNGSSKPPPSSQRSKSEQSSVTQSQSRSRTTQSSSPTFSSLFNIPQPIKQLFDSFPLQVLPSNIYPLRSRLIQQQTPHSGHLLFSWTTSSDPRVASFNPSCLAWQIYLTARDLPFQTVPSSNHAAAGARLPLLVVNELDSNEQRNPWQESDKKEGSDGRITREIGPSGLSSWAANAEDDWPGHLEAVYPAYMSLVENEIRRAWLYHMNLTQNFSHVTVPLYIHSQSSSLFVRIISAFELRRAAQAELSKYPPAVDETSGRYVDAERAFLALENLMKRKRTFAEKSGKSQWQPTLIEAHLFAYLFLLLELPEEKWADTRLVKSLKEGFPGLLGEMELWKGEIGDLKRPEMYDWIDKAV